MKRIVLAVCAVVSTCAVLSAYAEVDVTKYVRNGLVAHYDGIRNAGAGVAHDPAATVWKDLSGNGYDLVAYRGNKLPAWTDGNCAEWTNSAAASFACSRVGDQYDDIIASAANVTIEFVADATIPSKGDIGLVTLLPNESDATYGNASWAMNFYSGQIGVLRGGDRQQTGFTPVMQTEGSGTCSFTLVRSSNRWYLYYKGELAKDSNAGVSSRQVRNLVLGAAGGQAGAGFVGKVYAVRIYNRALSANEVAANRVLDRVRFFNDVPEGYVLEGDVLKVPVQAFARQAGTSVSMNGESWGESCSGAAVFGETFTVHANLGSVATHGAFYGLQPDAPENAVYSANGVTFSAYRPLTLELRAFAVTHVWDGTASGNYTDAHWKGPDGNAVSAPVAGDSVYVPAGAAASDAVTLTAASAIEAKDLRLGRGFGPGNGYNGKVTLSVMHKNVNTLTGDLDVLAGATLTHEANAGATTLDNVQYRIDFAVGGDLLVYDGSQIHADRKGYPANKGPGYKYEGSGHGGARNSGGVCYGSVRFPVTLGSGSPYSSGGGAIRLTAGGTATVDGRIGAYTVDDNGNSRIGAGGSVWLTCGKLRGKGQVDADGGTCLNSNNSAAGGGGRVAVYLTDEGETFDSFLGAGGVISAYGGLHRGVTTAGNAAGTVYLETLAQGAGHGTLIIDNRGAAGDPAWFGADVTDAEVGDVIIRNGGNVKFTSGGYLKVNGNWTNGGTVTATGADNTLEFAGTGTSRITGQNTVGSFVCTAPDKTLVFDANAKTALTVNDNGQITMRGEEGHPVTLAGDPDDTGWLMLVKQNVQSDLAYLRVTNSVVSGTVLPAYESEDLGGNSGWSFLAFPQDGDPIAWTGEADDKWYNAANWNPQRLPIATDRVSIPAGAANQPTLSTYDATVKSLSVAAGAALTISGVNLTAAETIAVTGTVTTTGGDVTSGGAFTCAGALVATDYERFVFSNDVSFAGGAFTCARSTVELSGAAAQAVDPDGQTFYALTVANAGGATFVDEFTVDTFTCVPTAPSTLSFAAGKTVTATVLVLDGGAGQNLTLVSGTPGTPWNLKVTASQNVKGVTVSDSAATGLEILAVAPSTDGERNDNWRFNVKRAEWTGAKDSVFTNALNWSTGETPDENTLVSIVKAATISVNASTPVAVGGLSLGGGEGAVSLSFATNLVVNGTLEVKNNATLSLNHKTVMSHVTGAMLVYSGGVVTHAVNDKATTLDNVQYRLNLAVDGDLTVYEGGKIHAIYKGYPSTRGPGFAYWGASHGGMGGGGLDSYGSVRFPVTLGSGGQYGENIGGGAIRLTVGGTATIDGALSASIPSSGGNSRMSAGGSVWLTCAKLRGKGEISAYGAKPTGSNSAPGGGGRIAVYLTGEGETTDAFTAAGGVITAKGGMKDANTSAGAGTVYVETAADGEGRGTLIIDNANQTVGTATGFGADVTDAEVGDVIIRNGGSVKFTAGGHLTVYGDWTNGGAVSASAADGALEFAGTGTARITGKNTVGSLVCTAPGKTLVFDANANNSLTLYAGGELRLQGEEGNPVTLLGLPADAQWHVSLGTDVTTPIFFAAVSNSVSDAAITAKNSFNLGGNFNWSFPKDRNPGDPIVWTGAVSANWGDIANWDIELKPDETDSVFIRASGEPGQFMPVLTEGTTLLNNLTIEDGASLTLAGGDLTVTNAFATVDTGKLRATDKEKIVFSAPSVTFASAAGFESAESRVTLSAEGPQTVDAHGARFHRLTAGGNDVTFASDAGADDFRFVAMEDRTLAFAAGATLAAERLDLRGLVAMDDQENPYRAALTVCCAEAGSVWRLKAEDADRVVVKGVRVADSDATAGETVRADATCVNVTPSANAGWVFEEGRTFDWTGETSTDFSTAGNWFPAEVPGAGDRAVIACVAGATRTVSFNAADYPLGALEIGGGEDGGTVALTVKKPLQVGFLDVRTGATLTMATTGTLLVAGDAVVRNGGTVTHEVNPASMTELNALAYKLVMDVAGDLLVEAGGAVSAENKGFAIKTGPGRAVNNYQCTAHGGKCTDTSELSCYGSVTNPRDAGSGGEYTPGSGVVDLTVRGTLTVNGTVCASGVDGGYASRVGSAGSVLVHAAHLAGGGTIAANGCSCILNEGRTPAAGGRVAVYLTGEGATFDAFEQAGGKVTAYGGCSNPSSPPNYGSWNGAGTVFLSAAGEGLRGRVIIDNGGHKGGWTDLPIPESLNGDRMKTLKNFRVIVRNGGRLNVVGSMKLRDVDMATDDATLTVGTNVLTITTGEHRERRGWAANCTVTSNHVGTVWGRVEWRNEGFMLIVK